MPNQLAPALYARIEPFLPTSDVRVVVDDALTALASGDADAQATMLSELTRVFEDTDTEGIDSTLP